MTERPLPKGYTVDPHYVGDEVFSPEYDHWTVEDLIEMLGEHDPSARVWIGPDTWPIGPEDEVILKPVELILGIEREVIL